MNNEMNQIEKLIGIILRIGVLISAFIILSGLLFATISGTTGYAENVFPTSLPDIISGSLAFKPYAIIMLGTFLLVLTPVLRVVVSIYAFYRERDFLYTIITLLVLIILIISFVIGFNLR